MSSALERTDDNIRELTVLNRISDADMRKIADAEDSFQAALAYAQEVYGEVGDFSAELGNGFAVVDKSTLEGVGMIVLQWIFNEGPNGMFVSVAAVTEKNERVIFNDGSTGIYAQLREYTDRTGRTGGMRAPHGLRASTYDTCIQCKKAKPKSFIECRECGDESDKRSSATTYYIDVAA